MKIFKMIFSSIYWLVIFCLVLIALTAAFSALEISDTWKMLVVQSGSMEPRLKTGSLIMIKRQDTYSVGDIITFDAGGFDSTTHRVVKTEVKEGKEFFSTQGDANQAADRETISVDNVLGKIIFALPYLGYLISFTKTQKGFIFLIVVPVVIIVYSEILNIKKEILDFIEKKRKVQVAI